MRYSIDKPYISLATEKPEAMFGFSALASAYFMTVNNWEEKLGEILKKLKLVTSAHRVSLFSAGNDRELPGRSRLELLISSASEQTTGDTSASESISALLTRWIPELSANRTVRISEKRGRLLADQTEGLHSMVVIPVFSANNLYGALALEFLEQKRWRRMEYRLIRHFTQMLGAAIHRQRLLEAIKVDKRYFEELFHSSPFGIAILDTEGIVQHINRGFTEIFGYSEEDLAHKKLDDILPAPEDQEDARQLTKKSLSGKEIDFEAVRYRKDGAPVNVSILGRFLHPTPNESAVFSIYIDITERVKALRLSAENRQKYQGLFEMSNDGICIMEKGVFIEVNGKMPALFGCISEDLIGNSIFDYSPEFQPDGELSFTKGVALYTKALSGTPVTFEWLHQRIDGSRFYGEISLSRFELGGKLYAQGILRDISERKATEVSLKKRFEFINFLSRASSDLINLHPENINNAIVETLKQGAIFANCEYAQVFLMNAKGDACELYSSWHNDESANIDQAIQALVISKFNGIYTYLLSGNLLQTGISNFPDYFSEDVLKSFIEPLNIKSMVVIPLIVNNAYIGHIGFHSTTTEECWSNEDLNTLKLCSQIIANAIERKQVIRELEEAKQKAEESDQLKTAFLASMSHEIRTPMNHIIGFIELLKDPNLSEQEKNEFFSIIRNSGNHLLKLIDDIIDIAKIEANQLEIHSVETSLNDFLKEQYSAFREQLNNGPKNKINFSLSIPGKKVSDFVKIDTLRLQQVLTNLLANSIKFTREGSIRFGYEMQDENTLRFFVEDTGIGIPAENQQLIFDRFRQLDYSYSREFSGTGLGLAISKGLVELLGGTIWVKSKPGEGSTFFFTIPYNPLSPVQQQAAMIAKTSGEYNFEGKTILVVEDDEINYRFLEITLSKTRAHILHADNGQTAVEISLTENVDLVLMDIQIPVIDGYTATRMVKEAKPNLPVIAQTAHALDDERNQCIEAGADAYVAKPINRKQLLLKISGFLLKE